MKKALVLLLTVVLLAGVFSGCGDKEWTGKHEVEMVIDHYGTIVLEITRRRASDRVQFPEPCPERVLQQADHLPGDQRLCHLRG